MGLLKWFFRYKIAKGLYNAFRGQQARDGRQAGGGPQTGGGRPPGGARRP